MKWICFAILSCWIINAGAQNSDNKLESEIIRKRIGGSEIVGLGEVGHGFESINRAKSCFVDLLRRELNFDAVAFESSFTASVISFLKNDSLEARTKNFLYPFWNTSSVQNGLRGFLDNEKRIGKPLIIGFDIQEDCRFKNFSQYLIGESVIVTSADLLKRADSILSRYIGKNFDRRGEISADEYLMLIYYYDSVSNELTKHRIEDLKKKLLLRSIENRKWLCKYLTISGSTKRMYYRDSLMAQNIIWLKKELYGAGKFIICSANLHVSKDADKAPNWTGEWLDKSFSDRYFAIGIQKGRGDRNFSWERCLFKYDLDSKGKFDMMIYLDKLKKIDGSNWKTPCE